ncbi:MAG: G/U mismatch-specific DNA glycosylase [Cyanobacteria bacterium P01_A01_bin.114]
MADIIGPDLKILFCGINPSLYSVAVGHHFARPGNRFWKALHGAGFTPRVYSPAEDQDLLTLGYGVINVASRATARADELSKAELLIGHQQLIDKVQTYRPACLAVLGISAYRVAFEQPKAKIGEQNRDWHGARVWALPNPSGLNAHYQVADLAKVYKELRLAVEDSP